jgi:ABC-type polysaccharide/polyol phosphate export permease
LPCTKILIEPDRTEQNYWSDIWRYRELFYILAWRDISVRYKQTTIGIIWAILRPFLAGGCARYHWAEWRGEIHPAKNSQ